MHRCKRCEAEVKEPLDHLLTYHKTVKATLAEVWSGFTYLGGRRHRLSTEKVSVPPVGQETLPL